ncbi:MAG TPA: DNA polymerase III subunit delta [Acetobacteraceae bacterium]|nr:DNA polymerase III subunit delta [Acetobacteraceae bacterium]
MKVDARSIAGFLRDPGACRVVLLFGEDSGLIRERAEGLVRLIAGSLDDPFRVAELGRDELSRLPDEAASLSLTGGRRVVRVREAGEAALAPVQALLKGPGQALVVLEAGGLASRSRLRAAIEASADAASIGCYAEEGRTLETTIRSVLTEADVSADSEALAWLAGQLGADRAGTRRELEKLALYAGPGGRVDLEAAAACVGDLAGLSLDDALFAATAGDIALADRALELALSEGTSSVGVLRAGLLHLQRLHRARLAMDGGMSAVEAAKAARPPVFFRRVGAFARALGLWPTGALMAAMAGLADAERACKRTAAPDAVICRNAVLALARRAARGAARRSFV